MNQFDSIGAFESTVIHALHLVQAVSPMYPPFPKRRRGEPKCCAAREPGAWYNHVVVLNYGILGSRTGDLR
jgi:hypothetical protein